jgi:hypothetical protein
MQIQVYWLGMIQELSEEWKELENTRVFQVVVDTENNVELVIIQTVVLNWLKDFETSEMIYSNENIVNNNNDWINILIIDHK